MEKLNDELERVKSENEKSVLDLKADLKNRDLQIEQLTLEVSSLKESAEQLNNMKKEFHAIKLENVELQNKLHDAEAELTKAKDSANLNIMIQESNKIADLERQNRKYASEIEYLK